MKFSESRAAIAPALVRALGKLSDVKAEETAKVQGKEGKGSYTYTYATLENVLSLARPVLAKEGLCLMQSAVIGEEQRSVMVETMILHESGEWVGEVLLFPIMASFTPQQLGGLISYARRYQALAILGIASYDDDTAGAEEAVQRQNARRAEEAGAAAAGVKLPTKEQESIVMDWVAKIEEATADNLKEIFETAWLMVHPWKFPGLDNQLLAAKDKRKAALK